MTRFLVAVLASVVLRVTGIGRRLVEFERDVWR